MVTSLIISSLLTVSPSDTGGGAPAPSAVELHRLPLAPRHGREVLAAQQTRGLLASRVSLSSGWRALGATGSPVTPDAARDAPPPSAPPEATPEGPQAGRCAPPRGVLPLEQATYRLWLGPIELGRARFSVGAPQRGATGCELLVQAQAESAAWMRGLVALDDRYRVRFDADTLLPLDSESDEHGPRERRTSLTQRQRHLVVEQEVRHRSEPPTVARANRVLMRPAYEALTGLFALRARPLADGDLYDELLADGLALWRARLRVVRNAQVPLDEGGRSARILPAVRIEGELRRADDLGRAALTAPPERRFTLWLSLDPVPLLVRADVQTDLGAARIELTSSERPHVAGALPAPRARPAARPEAALMGPRSTEEPSPPLPAPVSPRRGDEGASESGSPAPL